MQVFQCQIGAIKASVFLEGMKMEMLLQIFQGCKCPGGGVILRVIQDHN